MASSASGASPGGISPGSGNAQGDSPTAAISTLAGKVRAKAGERLGSDAGGLKTAGRKRKDGLGDSAGATVPAPPFEERPELYVGAAFAGGMFLAGVIRWLGR